VAGQHGAVGVLVSARLVLGNVSVWLDKHLS